MVNKKCRIYAACGVSQTPIYYAISEELKIYLLTIYSKKDDNNIPSDNEIISLVNTYCV